MPERLHPALWSIFGIWHAFVRPKKPLFGLLKGRERGIGGSGGIRTHGTVPRTLVFKTRALNHSATLPCWCSDSRTVQDFKPVHDPISIYAKLTRAHLWLGTWHNGAHTMGTTPQAQPLHVLHVVQGAIGTSQQMDLAFTALIGSCVLVCLWDPVVKIGGMAHFVFPEGGADARFGGVAIAALMNKLVAEGAQAARLQAMLFGGARVQDSGQDIGQRNAAFAARDLAARAIPVIRHDLGGTMVRRVRFFPATGLAQVTDHDTGALHETLAEYAP
jgi:chemotaxis protein CheD